MTHVTNTEAAIVAAEQALLDDANEWYSSGQIAEMPRPIKLTDRQKQYIWLMGSFPKKIAVQGRGYRTDRLMYGIQDDELVIFGYSSPLFWLENRGLVRRLGNANAYVLTETGERAFKDLHVRGAGLSINRSIRKVTVKVEEGRRP